MGAPKRAPFNNHRFRLINMGYQNGGVRRSLVVLVVSFWVYLSALSVNLFRAFHKLFLRYEEVEDRARNSDVNHQTVNSSVVAPQDQEKSSMVSAPMEAEELGSDTVESSVSDSLLNGSGEREPPELFLSFKFPSFQEFARNRRVDNKLQLVSRGSFAEEEVFSCSGKNLTSKPKHCSSDCYSDSKIETLAREVPINVHDYHDSVEKEADQVIEDDVSEAELLKQLKSHLIFDKIVTKQFQFHFRLLSEKDLTVSDSDTDSLSSSHDLSIMSRLLDSNSDLSDGDFEVDLTLNHSQDSDDEGLGKELGKLEESEKEILEKEEAHVYDCQSLENLTIQGSKNMLEPENKDSKLEVEWEHQELIEQLRMEIRKVKATGLPTIAEDCESPRIIDDLKPWKIDEGLHRGGRISELHKVYRSYRERMRKFDILNYQKMYALGFLQSKDPFKSISSQKTSTPSLASLLSQTMRLYRENKRSQDDPMTNFFRELHGDLEMVYVGQLCLSWEFLHWQYEKALELWEADPYRLHRYNGVANEFQQLQVLMQRFLENERFEGPRVQYYVKNRCFLRNLLQVPVIHGELKNLASEIEKSSLHNLFGLVRAFPPPPGAEDNLKVKKKMRIKGKREFGVSGDMLIEILEESIRVFWQFIRADKDAHSLMQKHRKASHPELQDPADSELFSELQATLQKKERKLKEVLKGGNCVLRKLQRRHHDQEDGSSCDQVLGFFSQVEMKLVRRVLNMSRLSTDQLAWCSTKLSGINFARRTIHVEPSFLLFPC